MPVADYVAMYYTFLLFMTLFMSGNGFHLHYSPERSLRLSWFTLIFVLCYITFRELNADYFYDTVWYAKTYYEVCNWGMSATEPIKDSGFAALTYLCSFFDSHQIYFLVIGLIYTIPVYLVFKREYPGNYFVALLLFVCSFSFAGYGVNGLRNGLAMSLCIYAFFAKNRVAMIITMLIAISMHKSATLPIGIFIITKYLSNPRLFVFMWFTVMIAVLCAGNSFMDLFATLDIFEGDDRLSSYAIGDLEREVRFSHAGFRWDFVLYGALPIGFGYHYLVKRKYIDTLYQRLFCTYVTCNAFWLLLIYRPYNNRFAYLSWFLYPIILSHPLLKEKDLIKNQHRVEVYMILGTTLFTYFMYLIS